MRILLDTHALLWMVSSSDQLSDTARDAIINHDNALYFSIAGYWEIGIKSTLHKVELAPGWQALLPAEMTKNGITWLRIEPMHVHEVAGLPWIHRDPFDRLMVAQARVEKLAFATCDSRLGEYGVPIVW
jgi:PIN domain nuclease of toxin-antitoxin system